jgi:hypothetical protein
MFPQSKTDVFLQTTAVTDGATGTAVLDTLGFDFVTIDLISTTADDATNNMDVLKLSESDDLTTYADITEFVGDGVGGFTIPAWHDATADAKVVRFNVDTRHRKRYLMLTVVPKTNHSFTAVAHLYNGEVSPTSAADVNALVVVAG